MVGRRGIRRSTLVAAAVLAAAALAVVAPASPGAADGNEAPNDPGIFRSITAGGNFTCVRVGSGSLRCWGENGSGQLGHGNTTNLGDNPNEMRSELLAVPLGTGRSVVAGSAG